MSPENKIKKTILLKFLQDKENYPELPVISLETEEDVEKNWLWLIGDGYLQDYIQDFRYGEYRNIGIETDVYSRHYEADVVAAEMFDGTFVGWLYWHGGGKHGEPEAIDWMDEAFELESKVELKEVRTFARVA